MRIFNYEQYSHTKKLIRELNNEFINAIDKTEQEDFKIKKFKETSLIILKTFEIVKDAIKSLFNLNNTYVSKNDRQENLP